MKIEETQLTDPHTGKYTNGVIVKILNLQRNIAIESWIDETGGYMGCKTKTTKRRLAFETRSDVFRDRHSLVRRTEDEFVRIKDETFIIHSETNILQIMERMIHGIDLTTTEISYDALGKRNIITTWLKICLVEWRDHMPVNTKIFDFGIVKH